jgi:hypothetical protein
MLSACSTMSEQPIVINNTCTPPGDFMQKHEDLPVIAGNTISEKQAIDLWLDDIQKYNNLNLDHSALIDWVTKYCK